MGLRAGEAVTYRLRRGEQELEVEVTPVSPADLQRMNTQRPDPSHAVLGVTLDQGFAQPGARLVGVQPSGPAASAGIQGGDIIQMLDGQMVRNMAELTHMLRAKSPGDLVELGVWRDGRTLRFQVKLGSRGDVFEREEE